MSDSVLQKSSLKMRGFGQYLVDEGVITEQDYQRALEVQNKNRLLGEIAIEANYLNRQDLPAILTKVEKTPDMRFGEAAISLGLLNTNQLRYLLDLRTRRKVPIGDALVSSGFIEESVMLAALMRFNQLNHTLEKVLIVDPSATSAKLVGRMIEQYGYTVSTAHGGAQALEMARSDPPDILLTSGVIGDIDGVELSDALIAEPRTSNVSIILVSSNDSAASVERAFERGVNHFLKKPFSEKELINVIYQIEKEVSTSREEKVLVVDDSRSARVVIFRELSKAGFRVFQAGDGVEAVEMAKEIKPDIMTMDLNMPFMNGFEACRALKDDPETAEIPVIIVTSETGREVRLEGFDAGAVEFFEKPFKSGRLAAYVQMLLETRKITKKERVLIAEDSNVMRHMFKYLFNKNGYNVYTAKDGQEALELLPECNPDLIVTDCNMPKVDGYELVRRVRSDTDLRHLPIIMVTGAADREDILKGLAVGCNDYIEKPFDEAELLARASTHLLNKKLYDEVRMERDRLGRMQEQLKLYSEQLEKLARTDSLTGAYNRRHFLELSQREIVRSIRHKLSMCALIFDIDHFKTINDSHGHAAGDAALVAVVRAVVETLRSSDIFCRYGGEEFAAVLVETSLEGARQTAERIREKIQSLQIEYEGAVFQLTVSVGVTQRRDCEDHLEALLKRADKALYRAKDSGRNRVESD